MKRRRFVLVTTLNLLILSLLFSPISAVSLSRLVTELLIRCAIVLVFVVATSSFLDVGTVELYRLTGTPAPVVPEGGVSRLEPPGPDAMNPPQSTAKQRRSLVVFWVVILAIYLVTQSSWWAHQAWVGMVVETLVRWGIVLACWGFLILLWLPKPDANQPEQLHVVPSKRNEPASGV